MYYGKHKKKKVATICASLAIHLLIILCALHDYHIPFISPLKDPKELPQKDWAERNPLHSRFGAPIVFQNNPVTTHKSQNKYSQQAHTKNTLSSSKKSSPVQKTLTAAQLLQGYLEQKGSGSDAGLKCKGSKKQPPDEQIKYERYAQKIHWCIQNAFNINKRTLLLSHPVRALMQFHIDFKTNGTVQKVQLVQSSGSTVLDQFMLDLIQYAGSSFPPIPDSFDASLLPHSYSIAVDVPATTGSNMHMSL